MRTKNLITIFILSLFMIGVGTSVYASDRLNLVDRGVVKINRVPSPGVRISKTSAYQEAEELVISGKLKRRSHHYIGTGFVSIRVTGPDGKILKQICTSYKPSFIRRNPTRGSHFKVRLPIKPPHGSKVRISHHRLVKNSSGGFQCVLNTADGNV